MDWLAQVGIAAASSGARRTGAERQERIAGLRIGKHGSALQSSGKRWPAAQRQERMGTASACVGKHRNVVQRSGRSGNDDAIHMEAVGAGARSCGANFW